jgi:hypothetical protein
MMSVAVSHASVTLSQPSSLLIVLCFVWKCWQWNLYSAVFRVIVVMWGFERYAFFLCLHQSNLCMSDEQYFDIGY